MMTESEFSEILRLAMDRSNAKVRTAFPARVTAFDSASGPVASVQPAIQAAYWDVDLEEPVYYDMPEITNCPVHYPMGGGFRITFPLQAGDDCIVLIAERSIDEWMGTGNAQNTPRMLRRFDLSDAIVIPGLAPKARALENFDTGGLEILHETNGSVLRINDDGTVYLGDSTVDLVGQTSTLADELDTLVAGLSTYITTVSTATTVAQIAGAAVIFKAVIDNNTIPADIAAVNVALATIVE